ncbi:hypothetical protein B296_00057992 [Ensete ventricosum]|uniref:Uncharacterized protein n=1 Tax=Ensete ventricosum TaxID=4639 RepID=A0A426XA52_ENSVE|nr:hypothetical protein B296_00057992 [Ensete ventricosum]
MIRLAVHLEHLSHTPAFIGAQPDQAPLWRGSDVIADERFYEPGAGPAEEVRAGVHCAGKVRPPVGDRWRRSDRVRRHRSSACRGGPRVHQRAAPQAAVLRGARLRRRSVAVAAGLVLPFSEAELLLGGERLAVRRLGQGKAACPGSGGGLSCVSVGATGASGGAKAAQVCGHLSPVPGASAQPWPLAGDRCEAGRGEGED